LIYSTASFLILPSLIPASACSRLGGSVERSSVPTEIRLLASLFGFSDMHQGAELMEAGRLIGKRCLWQCGQCDWRGAGVRRNMSTIPPPLLR
jgi:hypothetical protein